MASIMSLFNGRNGRFEYWMVHVFMFVCLILLALVAMRIVANSGLWAPFLELGSSVGLGLIV